jgi:hypothetical protein
LKTKVKILDTPCDYLDEEMPAEIDFSNGKPNPYVKRSKLKIELAPDVAQIFSNSEEVNNALRILMQSARRIQSLL